MESRLEGRERRSKEEAKLNFSKTQGKILHTGEKQMPEEISTTFNDKYDIVS